MSLRALLDGPRGRRLLFELAIDLSQAAHGSGYSDWPAWTLLWQLQHEFDPNRDRSVVYRAAVEDSAEGGSDASAASKPASERVSKTAAGAASWAASKPASGGVSELPSGAATDDTATDEPATLESLAAALARELVATLASDVAHDALTVDVVREALIESVDSARYWQEPDGRDVLAGTDAIRPVLLLVLAELEASGFGSWWPSSVDLDSQFDVGWSTKVNDRAPAAAANSGNTAATDAARAVVPAIASWSERTRQLEQRAAKEWPTDPNKGMSSDWWSTPGFGVVTTSRWVSEWQSPAALWLVEDTFGYMEARVARGVPKGHPRVFEITGATAWAELCARYPIEVTAQKRRDWYVTTGRTGVWVMPDWTAVSRDYDAVHLTVLGYLSAAGTAIPVGDNAAGLIAGWAPDETVWLTESVSVDEAVTTWSRTDAEGWRPAGE